MRVATSSSATTPPTSRRTSRSSTRRRCRRRTPSAPSPASAAKPNFTAPIYSPRSPRCGAASPSPARMARPRPPRWSCTRCAAAGWTPAGSNAGWGAGEWVVVEADESDRSLLKLHPDVAVLTNAELDHHSTYSSRLDVDETFRRFLARAREGIVVWDRPELRALVPTGNDAAPMVAYDVPDPSLGAEGVRFTWRGIPVQLQLPGAHNALNAAAALEACRLAGADPQQAAEALSSFQGAGR